MSQAQDLAALAAQFGGKPVDSGKVDYAVLAREFGGTAQEPPKAEPAKPEGKSVGGFLNNALTSTGRFLRDTAVGTKDALQYAATVSGLAGPEAKALAVQRTGETAMNAPAIGRMAMQGAKDRYGSLNALGETAYNDPAGLLADLSTVLTLGSTAAATKAPKIAGTLKKAADLTNPLRVVTEPAGRLANKTANLTVRGTLRPPKAVRDDFGGSKGVADAVLKERVYSDASAQRKLSASTKEADDLLAAKEAAGVRGVSARNVADSLTDTPAQTAGRRQVLGVDGGPQAVADRRQRMLDANAVPGNPNATRMIPLTEAQALKREAQDLAYEAAKSNLSLDQKSNTAVARALREGIEGRVPEVKPINERSQRLLGAKRAFAEAEDRPRALTNFLSLLGGAGGFAGGGPVGAAGMMAAMKAIDSPRAGALAGITMNEAGNLVRNRPLNQAALLARLLAEQQPDE